MPYEWTTNNPRFGNATAEERAKDRAEHEQWYQEGLKKRKAEQAEKRRKQREDKLERERRADEERRQARDARRTPMAYGEGRGGTFKPSFGPKHASDQADRRAKALYGKEGETFL